MSMAKLLQNIRFLLNMIGTHDFCKGCGKEIWWVVHPKTNKSMPINSEGLSHFADCPRAEDFKK